MKLLSIIILKHPKGGNPILLSKVLELSSFGFFQRGSMEEVCVFVSRSVVERMSSGSSISVQHKEYLCHAHETQSGLAGAVVCDNEYPQFVAFNIIKEALQLFASKYANNQQQSTTTTDINLNVPGLPELLIKYQDPSEADKVLKVQKTLDETKEIIIQSIDSLLERGEKLDDLVQRSNDLSFQSKAFAKKADELNSCCTLL